MPAKKKATPSKKTNPSEKKSSVMAGNTAAPKAGSQKDFYIVGIGASAGGLDAFERFFESMPKDSGMAFVLVPHLDPTHVSLMPELIQKRSPMPVVQVKDGIKVLLNTVHIVPPNHAP